MESSTQRQRTSIRRREILDASLRCFMRHGVEAATIEQIRETSGASSGSIYHHFGSKQAIAIALYVDGMEELAGVFRDAMAGQADLQYGIRAILKNYFRWVAEHRDWALYLLRVATADVSPEEADSIDEINRRTREDLGNWLRPFVIRQEIVALPDELYASLLFGAATHYARHWLAGRLSLDLDDVAESLSLATGRALLTPRNTPGESESELLSLRPTVLRPTMRTKQESAE